jgi:hypothetical protein
VAARDNDTPDTDDEQHQGRDEQYADNSTMFRPKRGQHEPTPGMSNGPTSFRSLQRAVLTQWAVPYQ